LSKDTFEHVADPVGYVRVMEQHLAAGGDLVIAFGPLWKSPWGSHLWFMTEVPWVHLVFPEDVMLAERERFRPWEAVVTRLEDVPGGLNRMTLGRFEHVMAGSGLKRGIYEVDFTSDEWRRLGSLLALVNRRPRLREYFAEYVFSIWR